MKVERIHARGFRNIEDQTVELSDGVNLLIGNNAEGKTNLLEAIYYFARGKSFRGATDRELCGFTSPGYEISLGYTSGGRAQSLTYRYAGGQRVRLLNGAPAESAAEMIGRFRAVLFHPEHLELVKGAPSLRREFLNIAIAQNDPSYLAVYATYKKILEERNSCLKMMSRGLPVSEDELYVWSVKLAEAAARVTSRRYEYIDRLAPEAAAIMADISGGREQLQIIYQSEIDKKCIPICSEMYVKLFTSDVRREVAAGFTVFGPHHDDIGLSLGGHPAREFASQGQQRSITLAMKLAEGEVSRAVGGEYPVFLFDDVMSELDNGRRQYLLSSLAGRQLIVTSCEEGELYRVAARRIRTKGGVYEAVSE